MNRIGTTQEEDEDNSQAKRVPSQESQPPAKQNNTVVFSLNTMGEFTHEELQKVIIKYDQSFKATKKQLQECQQQLRSNAEYVKTVDAESNRLNDQNLEFEAEIMTLKDKLKKTEQEN